MPNLYVSLLSAMMNLAAEANREQQIPACGPTKAHRIAAAEPRTFVTVEDWPPILDGYKDPEMNNG